MAKNEIKHKKSVTAGLLSLKIFGILICAFSVAIVIILNIYTDWGFWGKCGIVIADILVGASIFFLAWKLKKDMVKSDKLFIDDLREGTPQKEPKSKPKYTEYGNLQISINVFALASALYLTTVSIYGTIFYSDDSTLSAYCCSIICGVGITIITVVNTIYFKKKTWFMVFRDVASFISILPAVFSISNIPMGDRRGGYTLIYCIILAAQWAMTSVAAHRKPVIEEK